jgi:Planctomycete cytochrome C
MKTLVFTAAKNIITATVIVLFLFLVSTTGCYYDKEEVLYPDTICDTANVTYSRSVIPILSSNCITCHGGNTPSAGIKLDTYADVKVQATNGRLWGAVSHAASYSPMPKNAAKMSTCNLTKIKKWLDAGALNN